MKFYLVQHGEATSEEVDPSRPLTAKGHQDVQKMSSFLKAAGLGPLTIRHSGKARARQTAEIITTHLGSGCQVQQGENLGPNDPVQRLAQEISEMTGEFMIVGHLPFLGKLASTLLAGSDAKNLVAFRQGGVVCLQRSEDKAWQVAWMVAPELLR